MGRYRQRGPGQAEAEDPVGIVPVVALWEGLWDGRIPMPLARPTDASPAEEAAAGMVHGAALGARGTPVQHSVTAEYDGM